MALCETTPPSRSLAEYTLYSPLLCWYFWQSKCSLKISLVLHRHRRVAWGSWPVAWNLWAGTSSLCFRPLRPFVKFAILNSIICLPLFDVCGQWPLLVIIWFSVQLWACCNKFLCRRVTVVLPILHWIFSSSMLSLCQTEVWDLFSPDPGGVTDS